jgi:hypothetical protein
MSVAWLKCNLAMNGDWFGVANVRQTEKKVLDSTSASNFDV